MGRNYSDLHNSTYDPVSQLYLSISYGKIYPPEFRSIIEAMTGCHNYISPYATGRPTLLNSMMSDSSSLTSINGSIMSFLISFLMHSIVTTLPLQTKTEQKISGWYSEKIVYVSERYGYLKWNPPELKTYYWCSYRCLCVWRQCSEKMIKCLVLIYICCTN